MPGSGAGPESSSLEASLARVLSRRPLDILYAVFTNETSVEKPRRRGRPRNPELRRRILVAATRLAAESGVDVGFDSIAQAAGASRTTLYRWWSNPQELLLDALLDSVRFSMETDADTSTLARLRSQVELAAAVVIDPPTGAPLRALASAAMTREAAHAAFLQRWLAPRRAASRALIEQGIAEGTIVNEDPEVLIDVLFAPIYHRAFFTGGPLDDDLVDALIRRVSA